jgi:hypothetical protein
MRGAERVAQLVEGDLAHAGGADRFLEPARELGAIERAAALGVAEDEGAIGVVGLGGEVVVSPAQAEQLSCVAGRRV